MNSTLPIILKSIGVFMISNKSKWKCNSGWYVHLYSFVYAAQQQGGYHPPFKLRGKLVLLLLLLGFEIFYQKPCRWFDPLFQCVCILKKISLLISSLAAKNHTPSPHKPNSHPLAKDWELAHLWPAFLFKWSQCQWYEILCHWGCQGRCFHIRSTWKILDRQAMYHHKRIELKQNIARPLANSNNF